MDLMLARRARPLVAVLCLMAFACASWSTASARAAAAPTVEEESTLDVAATSATLSARLDANEVETEYRFEYGPTGAYGQVAPVPSGTVGAEFAGAEVSTHVQGLMPNTKYHYRVVAVNSLGTAMGEDRMFQTQGTGAGSTLLDGREWEMVSPPQKHGAQIYGIAQGFEAQDDAVQAAANGDALAYLTSAPTEGTPPGYSLVESLLSVRGADGWRTQDISTPHSVPTGLSTSAEYRLFSSDLAQGIVQPHGPFEPALSAEASGQTAYLRTNYPSGDVGDLCTNSCYRPLVTGKPPYANVPPGTEFDRYGSETIFPCNPKWICGPQFADATPDLEHVMLYTEQTLTATPTAIEPLVHEGLQGAGGFLYEWSDGQLTPISVLPNGELANFAALGGPLQRDVQHAISNDGSRVFWSAEWGSAEPGLYMYDVPKGETVKLAPTTGEEGRTSRFQTASNDGSRMFFTTGNRLTADSGGGPGIEEGDLYECEIVELSGSLQCDLSDLTPINGAGESAGVLGTVLGASEDGSYVYFVANGVLAPGAVPGQCSSSGSPSARCNLYLYHDGVTKLVAVLANEDGVDWSRDRPGNSLSEETARVSPDGRWLAFMSDRELTGYDNRDAVGGQRDEEVYLYDAQSGRLVCASCDPTGARPDGAAEEFSLVDGEGVWRGRWLAANVPGWTPFYPAGSGHAIYQSRFLSNSGRLFFNSHDALVPRDVNGTWDVYEYEPPGTGNCETSSATFRERSGGCIGLLSAGSSPEESAFLDAGEGGADVFLLTASKLSGADTDTALDVYDAHECSVASPCAATPASQPPPCTTGDACKAAPTPQPAIYGAPASATFSGAGNVVPSAPSSVVPKRAKSKGATRAQKLAKALRACRRKPKHDRAACVRRARARFAVRIGKATTRQGSRG
jgi:hypothetical protein